MAPEPAFRRFDRLIGRWEMTGRTLDAAEDNIFGWNTFEWLLDGRFLKSEGEINFKGVVARSIEIIAYDAERQTFPSNVYSTMSGEVSPYRWDMHGDTLIHAGYGATYSGTISADGNTITGGWRPDPGSPLPADAAYDAIMTRVK